MKQIFPGELSHVEKDLSVSFFPLVVGFSRVKGLEVDTNSPIAKATLINQGKYALLNRTSILGCRYYVPMSLYLGGLINSVHGCLLVFFFFTLRVFQAMEIRSEILTFEFEHWPIDT